MSRSAVSKNPSKETDIMRMIFRIRVPPVAAKDGVAVVVPFNEALPDPAEQGMIQAAA